MTNNALNGIPTTSASSDSSSTNGDIQKRNGTVSIKVGSFRTVACAGQRTLANPDTKGICMDLISTETTIIEICSDLNQYIYITNMTSTLKNETYIYTIQPIMMFKMQINRNSTLHLNEHVNISN